ncbi:MAG TPA: thioredoxin domain-containing protein [Candidatus Binataceae bacterium]|nr:thioredoxin domain-containing protein [Candidatus Binataceae bacterium]
MRRSMDDFRPVADSRVSLRVVLTAVLAAIVITALPGLSGLACASGSGPETVVATVGSHSFTESEVDSKVASQIYDLRKQALDQLIDDYVVDQAAKKAHMKPDEYLDQQVKSSTSRVTEAETKQFYDEHKSQLDSQTGNHSFDQIKPRLMAALQREQDRTGQETVIQRLRSQQRVQVLLEAPHVKVASAGHPTAGSPNAPITIVEFGDFQCPFCRAAENQVKQVQKKYGKEVKVVYLDFPLSFHPHAMDAARAALCAGDQNKFWQYHDALFDDQKKLGADDLKQTAAKLGLDKAKFDSCFASDAHDAAIQKDMAEGRALGVTGTPTFFINGQELVGAQPLPKFDEAITEELARAKQAGSQNEARAN